MTGWRTSYIRQKMKITEPPPPPFFSLFNGKDGAKKEKKKKKAARIRKMRYYKFITECWCLIAVRCMAKKENASDI